MNIAKPFARLTPLALALALALIAPRVSAQEEAPLPPLLPLEEIQWETNMDEPPIGDPNALKGGTFNFYMADYPLTFRLMGPNAADAFASWNRSFSMDFALVNRHPSTDEYIPWMATHWFVQKDSDGDGEEDNKVVYYKLDPDARWSDGKPVTADDYIFTYEMMGNPKLEDPFYKDYRDLWYRAVEKIDPYTLRIVGKQLSWKPLADYNLWAMPRHALNLEDVDGEAWVKRDNYRAPTVQGPYILKEWTQNDRVVFERLQDWWGKDKHYWRGMFNPDRIIIKVVPDNQELDYFKKREIDYYQVNTSRIWAEEMDFEATQKGWARMKRVFTQVPAGIYGLHMNLGPEAPIFHDKNVRKAIQHMFDFDKINNSVMYGAYYRQVSAFEGTEYANPDLESYAFDPKQARELLAKAGYKKRGSDGILVNDKGQRMSFNLTYGSSGLNPHLGILQQDYKRAGIEMNLQLLDGASAYYKGIERKYEMTLTNRTSSIYPSPRQYFHSEFKATTNNNNIWYFGGPETDKLIETYMFSMDKEERLEAMHELDEIIWDEAFYIPFWEAPYIRMLYWDRVAWPEFMLPKRTEQIADWQVFWIDPQREKRLEAAMREGKSLGALEEVDVDHFGVKPEDEE